VWTRLKNNVNPSYVFKKIIENYTIIAKCNNYEKNRVVNYIAVLVPSL